MSWRPVLGVWPRLLMLRYSVLVSLVKREEQQEQVVELMQEERKMLV